MLTTLGGRRGTGAHASLSRFDLRGTLIASGPSFKKGYVSEIPSGNVDVAPTVLALLGVAQPKAMDGRVLGEGLAASESAPLKPERETLDASRDLGARVWHQFLRLSRVGAVVYFDEGNGESRLK